jgi:hypothetical protein
MGSNPISHPSDHFKSSSTYHWPVSVLGLRLSPRSILVVALMVMVVVAVMFGIDLINGRWDQPPIQPQL